MNQKISLTGIHVELTEAIKNITTKKLQKLFRHSHDISGAKVELECSDHKNNPTEFIAKAILSLRGPAIAVRASTDNLYKSIDVLIDKLDRKLSKRARLFRSKRRNVRDLAYL